MNTKTDNPKVLLDVKVCAVKKDDRTTIEFAAKNNGSTKIWLPQEQLPAYQLSKDGRQLIITYGYFDDIYGLYREQYMIPNYIALPVGQLIRWKVDDHELVKILNEASIEITLRLRIAFHEIVRNRNRGQQQLDKLLDESVEYKTAIRLL